MTVWPVIDRELRTQARLPFTYGLRVLSMSMLLLAAFYFGARNGFNLDLGGALFGYLNFTLFCAVWILVPLFTADCISREKREGTMGLLFLTPLRARDIVLAKGLVHGLRALTLWLAVLPVLTIPFLLGGITWKEAVLSVLMNFSCICWALAAGLLASAAGKVWVRSLLLAGILALCFLLTLIFLNGVVFLQAVSKAMSSRGFAYEVGFNEQVFLAGLYGTTDFEGLWGRVFGMIPPAQHWALLRTVGLTTISSILVLLGAVHIAARGLQQSWQERTPPAWRLRLEHRLCTPVIWVPFFHRWLRRKLERNPIGWLEQRTWSGRLVTWGWFAVMVSLYSLAFNDTGLGRAFQAIQQLMACLLIGSLAVSAAGSFRRERETGVLELLLVSPMSEGQIIGGRLRGLWGQFLPAMIVLIGIGIYFNAFFHTENFREQLQLCLVSFLTLPVIGLYFSLRRSNFMSALLFTLLFGLGLPMTFPGLLHIVFPEFDFPGSPLGMFYSQSAVTILQLLAAVLLGRRLYSDLVRRNFAFSHAVT
jgi:ABC-type transport system involved in multi-copper enzyme maturation permease subunit